MIRRKHLPSERNEGKISKKVNIRSRKLKVRNFLVLLHTRGDFSLASLSPGCHSVGIKFQKKYIFCKRT